MIALLDLMGSERFIFFPSHPTSAMYLQEHPDRSIGFELPKVHQFFGMRTIFDVFESGGNLIGCSPLGRSGLLALCKRREAQTNREPDQAE